MRVFLAIVFSFALTGCAHKPGFQPGVDASPQEFPKTEAEMTLQIQRLVAGMKQHVDDTRDRLLHHTDHDAVLRASREIMKRRGEFKHDAKWRGPDPGPDQSYISVDDPGLPAVIRELRARSIFAFDRVLRIEFGGGFHHQGFIARDAGTNAQNIGAGLQKIIDGLYFYEDTR